MIHAEHSALVLVDAETEAQTFRPGFARKIIRTADLMTVVIDIEGGPWTEPDPMHAHSHEQISYVASGEVLFLSEGQPPKHLRAGDLFAVASGVPHSIQLLSPTARLVDTFHPIREDFL
ncbi:cupin domain-containing protein [uncultured Paludibaculum sp.]|uniref:cupin domain-containing protein n=1 Tax=uncultured Paludibaculum sp. TaxID=1765020 RepID=UPI002AABAE6F|nr:cupin domain-containing protein [uncultured Paludibaculum sp.]